MSAAAAASSVNQKQPDVKTSSSGGGGGAAAVAVVLKAKYRAFNDRMKEFLADMVAVYGKQSPSLVTAKRQMEMFLASDPARMRIAHLAWPLFSKHKALIEKRNPDVFFKYDLAGLQAKGKLDVKELWAKASANTREALWRAVEDFLDLLEDINKVRAIPNDEDDDAADLEKKNNTRLLGPWHEALDTLVPPSSLPPIDTVAEEQDDDDDDDDDEEDDGKSGAAEGKGKGAGAAGAAEWTKGLMSSLKDMIGGDDPSVDEDFQALMSKLNEPEDGKTTPQDQETMTRILHHFIEKISPMASGGGDGEDEDMENMSLQEKEAERSRRQIAQIQLMNELKFAIGKMMSIESLQKTNDPTILENDKRETAAEQERMKNPDKNREYKITAHFNNKLLLFLNKMYTVRGGLKSKKDGRVVFPGIKNALSQLLTQFKENPATEAVIRPVGQWVVEHRAALLNRDDKLFLEPDHPFLVEMQVSKLWQTFKPHERVNFWSLIGHPLQLATIFHHLDNDDLRPIADIVNDLLAAGNISYDRDPKTLNGKQVITKAIQRGCTTNKIGKIRALFERMQKEPDQRTLKSLAKLMQDVLPQAAGMRGNAKSHNEDDAPPNEEDSGANAARESSERMQQTFAKLLKDMPNIGSLMNTDAKDAKDSKSSNSKSHHNPDIKFNSPATAASLPSATASAPNGAAAASAAPNRNRQTATAPPPSTPASS